MSQGVWDHSLHVRIALGLWARPSCLLSVPAAVIWEQAGNGAAHKCFFLWHCFYSTQVPLGQAFLISREHSMCLCLCSLQPDTDLWLWVTQTIEHASRLWSRWPLPVTASLAEGTRFGGCLLVPELTNVPSGCQDVHSSSCHLSDCSRLPHCHFSGWSGFGINISRPGFPAAEVGLQPGWQCVTPGLCRCRDRATASLGTPPQFESAGPAAG